MSEGLDVLAVVIFGLAGFTLADLVRRVRRLEKRVKSALFVTFDGVEMSEVARIVKNFKTDRWVTRDDEDASCPNTPTSPKREH